MRRRVLIILLVIILVGGVASLDLWLNRNAYVNVPFSAGLKGASVEVVIHVPVARTYFFNLDFHFRENDANDRARVQKVVGAPNIGAGISTSVRIYIVRIKNDAEEPILTKAVTNPENLGYTAFYFNRNIIVWPLSSGIYRVKLEDMQNIEELKDIPVYPYPVSTGILPSVAIDNPSPVGNHVRSCCRIRCRTTYEF
jgi:hypothetical protein